MNIVRIAKGLTLSFVVGVVMLSTVFMILGNFLADVMLVAADPRIRMQ